MKLQQETMNLAKVTFVALAKPSAASRYTVTAYPQGEGLQPTLEVSSSRLHTWLRSLGNQDEADDVAASCEVCIRSLSTVDLKELGFQPR